MKLMSRESVQYFYSMQNQLKDHIYNKEKALFDEARAKRDNISTVEELKEYGRKMRQKFIDGIGGIAGDETELNAEITSTKEYDDYKTENIIFTSRRNTYVTGTMYIPHGLKEPSAAILFLHGHSDDTRHYPPYQIACDTFARAGFIVFSVDPVGQGERTSYYDPETGKHLIEPCVTDHDAAGIPATATDRFIASYFLSDEKRALDYMLTRKEIDPERIGVTGNSGAGTQTLVMMATDDRIAAAAPGTFVSSREAYMLTGEPQDSEQIWFGATSFGFDHITPIMIMAPKPVAILSVNYDFYCIEGTKDTVDEAKRFYEMYGKPENLEWIRDDSLHEYTPNLAVGAAKFFAKHLLGKEIEITNDNYVQRPFSEFFCTQSGHIKGEINGARFLFDENKDEAKKLYDERHSYSDAERLQRAEKWLGKQVTNGRTPCEFYIRKHGKIKDGLVTEAIMWHSQKDVFNFAFMIRSPGYIEKKLPTVIALWQDGTLAINAHEAWIKEKCESGYEVMVLDVTGTGYIEQAEINAYPKKEKYATNYKLCGDMMYCGDSIAALRTWDVTRAIDLLRSAYKLDDKDITLYCESKYGVYGVMAAFLEKNVNVIYGDGLIQSVEKEYINVFVPEYDDDLALIMPKMLRYFDYNEIMRR